MNEPRSCCGSEENEDVSRSDVRNFYSKAAVSAQESLCCPTQYDSKDLSHIPKEVLKISYGCGSPVGRANLREGEVMVDLGSGGGIDCFIAARHVGKTGRVYGIDMTEEMLGIARKNATLVAENLGYNNIEFRQGYLESIPIDDSSVDLVTSNCVINLSTDKDEVFGEIHRILKPGGRFMISDIISDKEARKKAERAASLAENEEPKEETPTSYDRMKSTTGRTLVSIEESSFEVDLGESEVKKGGKIIAASKALDDILEELETDLLMADMGHDAVVDVMNALRASIIGARINRKADLSEVIDQALRNALLKLLEAGYWDFDKTVKSFLAQGKPVSIMMVGVNGTGKTTTSAKLAHRLTQNGYSVVLAAADTFRAGAIDQLANHAERLGVRCIHSQRGGDASAIARDAYESAKARGEDIVIIDTAGRMQNKTKLARMRY